MNMRRLAIYIFAASLLPGAFAETTLQEPWPFNATVDGTCFGPEGDIVLPQSGACDPHIHIFEGKAWMYASRDEGPGNKFYKMTDWIVCSSPDLVHWEIEFVLKPEDTFAGAITNCWATDGAERNGNYYMYYSIGTHQTGVAVSTNGPAGPYVDPLGKPLLDEINWNNEYDPTIFIEDDGIPYILWGFGGDFKDGSSSYQIAELNDDMISLASEAMDLDDVAPHIWRDACYLHKHNGTYYLNTHQSHYASSTNLFGPYEYRGQCGTPSADHGGFFTWHNQTYYVYGHWYSDYWRHTRIAYCHYKDNGEIVSPDPIAKPSVGVGRYDADWEKIEAEWFFGASDGTSKRENSTGFELRNLTSGSYLYFPKVRNIPEDASMQFHVSSDNPKGGVIKIYQDSPSGKLLGTAEVKSTEGWAKYQTIKCQLSNTPGVKNITFVFDGGGESELLRLDWFKFESN